MAGALQGLKEVREDFSFIKAICGVGMMKSEKATEETVEAEKVSENAEAVEKSEITPEDVKDEAEGGTEA